MVLVLDVLSVSSIRASGLRLAHVSASITDVGKCGAATSIWTSKQTRARPRLSLTESWKEPEVSGIEGLDQLTQRDSASINRSEEMETLLQLCEHRHVVLAILLLPWVEVWIAIFTGSKPPCLVVWRPHILCVISARIFVVVISICSLPHTYRYGRGHCPMNANDWFCWWHWRHWRHWLHWLLNR